MTTELKELKEFVDNIDDLCTVEKFLNKFSEYAFTSIIGMFVDEWCRVNDHPHEKGNEILGNILAVRDDVEELLKEEKHG